MNFLSFCSVNELFFLMDFSLPGKPGAYDKHFSCVCFFLFFCTGILDLTRLAIDKPGRENWW